MTGQLAGSPKFCKVLLGSAGFVRGSAGLYTR
jgi:hypothetical protein